MPTGIPYPPPPGNVDLDAYFKYVGSQGYPVPYPVFIPQQVTAQSTNQTVKPRDTSATDVRGQTDEAFSPRDKLVPHPPAKSKKEDPSAPSRNTSPRRNIKHDGVPSQKNSPEPHNQKEKMEQCGNDFIPKKTEQKKREPKVEKQNPKVEQKTPEKMEDLPVMTEEERRDEGSVEELPLPDAPGNINSSQRHVEAIRQYHEQRRQLDAEEDALLERNRKFAKASLERYFTSLEQMREKSGEEGDTESFDKPASVTEEEENDLETNVNTEVTAATSVKAGGITNRIEQLGIDLSFLKKSQDPDLVPQETENKKGDTDMKSRKSKLVVICPECEEINKDYMSWCGNCGEVLIGIEPVSVKKSRGGKISVKPVSKAVLKKEGSRESKFTSSGDNTDGSVSQNEGARNEDSSSGVDAMFEEGSKETKKGKASQKAESNIERSQKEIAEICENITDPIVKGFIKSFLRKKKHDVTSTDVQTDRSMVTDKTSARSNAKPKVYSHKEKPAIPPKDKVKKLAMDQKKRNENVAKKPKVPSKQNVPVDERENDFITQCRSESSSEKEVDYWHHEQGQKNRPDRPLRYKNVPPIDIEVFAMEESRRSSRTSEPIVPSLNLVNSSDEEAERKKENAKIFSMSADSEDWEDFFNPNIPGGHQPAIEDPSPQEEGPQPFLERVLDDLETPAPKKGSKGAKKGPNVPPIRKSIVRESIETPGYQRKWEKSSSVWASRELGTRPNKPVKAQRPASAGMARRVGSEENLLNDRSPAKSPVMSKKPRPGSADMVKRKTMRSQPSESGTPDVTSSGDLKKIGVTMSVNFEKHADLPRPVDHRLQTEQVTEDTELPLPDIIVPSTIHLLTLGQNLKINLACLQHFTRTLQTPRIRVGEYSMWLCLPDELLLHVFSFLGHNDLASCARTCQQYHRVAKDPSLWKYITLKKKHDLTDEGLLQIGRHKPVSLALIQCHGENITAKGLKEMFRECADSLRELNFCGCSRGALTGDCILLHASARCHNLTHVDASWCNVSDSGVGAISNAANRLESLCINGCQLLSDEGFETVIKKHGKSLRVIEMFGCFNITPKGMRYLANNCVNLTTLNLGQCYKLTDICISQLSSSLGRVENLDLRGCKTIKDNCIRYVVKNCPRLKTISLANCPNISDVSLLEISTYLSDIRSIDVCGCRQVTDSSIRAIANNCQNLRYIDISSTGCTHRSVSMLANFCSQRIETMKLNFLSDLSENCLIKLLKHCKRLQLLHLYGCTSVRNIDKIRQVNPNVKIEL
ncbi:hypothetical protein FSP39_013151 [Pinctada imbricata]|uniref:F-box domain-containing protein n=1 Tax=Pinctada imbricata TaxID=66713 RepID=A0AA88YJV3_PINIB|nr:hypothetical protein FSP39_013151 [Pinctada imbricata]